MEALLNQAQLDEALASFTIKRAGFTRKKACSSP